MSLSRTSWVGLAAAGGVGAFLVATVALAAGDNAERTEELQRQLESAPPATAEQLAEQLDLRPPPGPPPPIVITAVPGPAGAAGVAGAPGETVFRTVTVTVPGTPAPAPTVTVTPAAPSPSPSPTASRSSCVFAAVPGLGALCEIAPP